MSSLAVMSPRLKPCWSLQLLHQFVTLVVPPSSTGRPGVTVSVHSSPSGVTCPTYHQLRYQEGFQRENESIDSHPHLLLVELRPQRCPRGTECLERDQGSRAMEPEGGQWQQAYRPAFECGHLELLETLLHVVQVAEPNFVIVPQKNPVMKQKTAESEPDMNTIICVKQNRTAADRMFQFYPGTKIVRPMTTRIPATWHASLSQIIPLVEMLPFASDGSPRVHPAAARTLPRQLLHAVYCKLLRDPEKQTTDCLASFPFCLSRKRQKSSSPPVKRLNPNTDTVSDNKGRLEGRIHGPAVHVALTS